MFEQVPQGISAEDWAATPVAVRALVGELRQRVAGLEERLNQTSCNSSRPPSSDPPYARPRYFPSWQCIGARPRPQRTPSGRKKGGQPGHVGHGRRLKPLAQVNRVVDLKPTACRACGSLLLGDDPQALRHQVTELPRIQPEVTEYRCHTLSCLACGEENQAAWPADMPAGSFGPRVQATIGYFTGRLGASQRDMAEVMETVFHTDLSLGSVPAYGIGYAMAPSAA